MAFGSLPATPSLTLPESDPLVHGFVILAFFVHAIFMNLVVGGTFVMVITEAIGVVTARGDYRQLASTLANWLPGFLGVAVVLGVMPLVFVQVLYGPLFAPTVSILGDHWIVAFLAAMVGYAGLYGYSHWRGFLEQRPSLQLALGVGISVMFLGVALVFVSASVLMLHPEQWENVRSQGFSAVLSLPSLLPRYGHLMLAAMAGMGIFLVCYGLFLSPSGQAFRDEDPKDRYATWVRQYGVAWTLTGAIPQIVVGPWLLLSLPSFVRGDLVSGQSFGSLAFFLALTAALLSLVLLNAALMVPQARGLAIGGMLSLVVTMCLMMIVRHAVRVTWLSQQYETAALGAKDQWTVFFIVAIMMLLGVGLTIIMVKAYQKRVRVE
ncbi:hypothetical protein [Candidatus Nitronereus thalassa]|uniref:Uncharacterized protein n=1 Tax=Candidatus Nitronereus thalassa TaxID=3020898 RepID=A0ABU3K7K6_9BACT|nr:hypothetical protein [Candidatus Nitronereus thalassa]MDT7042375.1 hypothetical protein [Candidatus Nitronereus thalassa]